MQNQISQPLGPTGSSKLLHREHQIQQLQLLLGLPHAPDVLVYGPSCTGKTSIVRSDHSKAVATMPHGGSRRQCSACPGRQTQPTIPPSLPCPVVCATCRHTLAGKTHAYISCCRAMKLRGILSSILTQLTPNNKRKRAHAFAAAAGTEHSLIWELKGVCSSSTALWFFVACSWHSAQPHYQTHMCHALGDRCSTAQAPAFQNMATRGHSSELRLLLTRALLGN